MHVQNISLQKMFDNIQSEKSTKYLLVDQLLVGFSANPVLASYMGELGSTFQGMIGRFHEEQDAIQYVLTRKHMIQFNCE